MEPQILFDPLLSERDSTPKTSKNNIINVRAVSSSINQEQNKIFLSNHFSSPNFSQLSACFRTNYDPLKVPPDIQLAKNHGLARRVCVVPNDRETSYYEEELCPCCGLIIKNTQFPICADTNDFVHMGSCFPLYFDFIKFCSILMLMLFLTSGIFLILSNDVFGGVCHKYMNTTSLVCGLSFIDLLSHDQNNVKIIRMLCIFIFIDVFIIILCLEMFKISMHLKGKDLDGQEIKVNDFTVILSHLPPNTSPNDLKEFILQKFDKPAKIEKIYFIYDFSEYERLYKERKKDIIEKEKKKLKKTLIANINEEKAQIEKLEEEISQENKELESFENALMNDDYSKMKFIGKALIIFSTVQQAKYLVKYWKFSFKEKIQIFFLRLYSKIPSNLTKFTFNNKFIKIKKAPLPSDIIWNNKLEDDQKWKPRLCTIIVTTVCILIGLGFVLALKRVLKTEQEGDIDQYLSLTLSFVGSTVVALINTILGIIIRKFATYESHSTKTQFFISVTWNLTRAFFMNMCVATFLSNLVTIGIRQFIKPYEVNIENLVNDIFFLFITNSYMSSIFNYFDIMWGYRLWQRYRIEKDGDKCVIPQCEVNCLYEGHPVDIALRYANILKTVFFTALYAPFIPLGYLFSIIGLIINFWVDKYLLIRRYVCENKISYKLPKFVMKFMKMLPILLSFTNIVIALLPLFREDKTTGVIKKVFWLRWDTFLFAFASFEMMLTKNLIQIYLVEKNPSSFFKNNF